MPDNNIPPYIQTNSTSDLAFNLDLDTDNRLAKIQTELKVPDFTITTQAPAKFYPDFKPSFNYEKKEVVGGKSIYDAMEDDDPNIRNKAILEHRARLDKNPLIQQDFGTPIVTDYSQSKKYLDEDFGFNPNRPDGNEDFYYNQNWASMGTTGKFLTGAWNTLGRVATGAVLKFGSGFGYMGSMLGNIGQDDYWGKVADNGFSKAMDQTEEYFKQELFRVYKSANYDNKGFFGKLTDASFWQDDFADGLAFMGSAMIPMGIFGKVGQAAKFGRLAFLAEDLAATTRVGKLAQGVFGATRGAQITEGIASGIEFATGSKNLLGITGHLYATASEAAFEATDRYKQARAQGLSTEEAGKQASQTFGYNMAILSFSNAFENKLVQKVLNRNKNGAFNSVIKIGDDLGVNVDKAGTKFGRFLQDNTWGKKMSFYGKQGLKGIGAEGLWEENAQLAVQRIAEGEYDSKEVGTGTTTKKKAGNFIEQLATQTYDAFQGKDNEAGTSIGIGSLIGVLGGVGTSIITRERSKGEANTLKAITEYNTARNNWLKNDVYEKNDNGSYKLDENKKLIIDPLKIAAREEKIAEMTSKLNLAKNTEIPNLKSYLERSAFTDFALAHINNDSIDFLIDRLDNWGNSDKETLAAYGFSQDLQEGVSPKKFAEIARDLKQIHGKTQDIKYEKPQNLSTEQASKASELAKQKVFELQSDAYHVSAILNEGFSNLSDEKYRNVNNLTSTIQNSVELIDVLKGKNGIDVAFKDLLEEDKIALTSYLKDNKNSDVVNEYAKIKKEQLDLTNSYNNIIDQIDLYSDTKNGIKEALIGLQKKEKEIPQEEIKEEPPKEVLFVIKGKNYYSQEEVTDDLGKGVITQKDIDNTQKKKETYDYTVINTGDKFQLQFGDKNVTTLLDSEELATKIGNNIKLVDGKFKPSFAGLSEEEIQLLTNIVTELNKETITPPVQEPAIIEKTNEEKINEILYSIKQLNDQYQTRVDNLLLNGATLEEAEMFAQAETPVEDVQALELLQKELAILTLDPTTLPIDLKLIHDDINKFNDLVELNNYLTGIDKGIQDLFKVIIENKVKELSIVGEPEVIAQPIELDPTDTSNQSEIERKRQEDLQKGQLFLMNDGTYGGSRLVSLEEYSAIQIQENNLDSDITKWDYNTFNGTGIFVNLSLGVAYIVPNNSYNSKKVEVVKVFINKTTKRFDLSNPRIINTPNIELVAKAANIDSKELYNEVLNAITKYDTKLKALEEPTFDAEDFYEQFSEEIEANRLENIELQEAEILRQQELTDVVTNDLEQTIVYNDLEFITRLNPKGFRENTIFNTKLGVGVIQIIKEDGSSLYAKVGDISMLNGIKDSDLLETVLQGTTLQEVLQKGTVKSILPEIENDLSDKVDEINIENNILEDVSEFTEPLAWKTAQKTANQEIEQDNGKDKLNSKGLKVLSSDEYSVGIGKLIQDLKDPTSYLSNKLKNDELELVLVKDKKEWFSFRNIEQEQEEGVVLVLRDKEGNLEELEDSGHPIIFTANKDAFKERYNERVEIHAKKEKISLKEAKAILDQTYTDLNEARDKVLNGEEVVVKYIGFGPGVINYNKVDKKITPYPIRKYFDAKDFSVGVSISVGSEKAGRPYITLNHDKGTKVYVGTAMLKDIQLEDYGSALVYIQNMLNTKFDTQEEAKKVVSNILNLVFLKDRKIISTPLGTITIQDEKGMDLSKDKISEELVKSHLKINSTKLNKGSIKITDDLTIDYPTLLKDNIQLIELPLQNKDGELVFRAYNSYLMFEIQKQVETTEIVEEVKEKKTRGRRKMDVDVSKLNSGTVIETSIINKKEKKKTDCNG